MVTPLTSLTDRVMEALMNDPRTRNEPIEVATTQNMITLTGTVKSAEVREAAEEIARRQEGVATVINELKVV
jgi:hyperosmotically inducible protein